MSIALMCVALVHCIAVGWMRWGDWVIDTGRELELPRRMLEGERLYSDLRFYYGPLAPYVNSLLYGVLGVRVEVLAASGIFSAILMCAALWMLTRRFAGIIAATAVGVTFLYACAFPHLTPDTGIFNFALPYTFSATYGIVSATWSVLFLIVYAETEKPGALAASAALLAVTALAKLEPLLPCACAHAVMWTCGGVSRRKTFVAYVASIFAVAAVYAVVALQIGTSTLSGVRIVYDNLTALMNDRSGPFIRVMMGLDHPARRLVDLAITWGGLVSAFGATVVLLGWLQKRAVGTVARVAIVALSASASFAATSIGGPDLIFAAAPPLALIGSGYFAARLVRRERCHRSVVPRLVLWVFTLGCLFRIFLRPTLHGYGFYLLAPFLVPLAILLFRDLPRRLHRSIWARRTVAFWGVGALLGTAVAAMRTSAIHYAARDTLMATTRGSIYVKEPVAPYIVAYLNSLPAASRVLVVPQSSALNFFSARNGADHMFSYLPMEFAHDEEAELIARWSRSPPDLIVVPSIDLGDFSLGQFGTEYALGCGEWIQQRYRPLPGPFVDSGILLAVPR